MNSYRLKLLLSDPVMHGPHGFNLIEARKHKIVFYGAFVHFGPHWACLLDCYDQGTALLGASPGKSDKAVSILNDSKFNDSL